MSNLRKAAEQALEALEIVRPQNMGPKIYPDITALRAALAEPQELNPKDILLEVVSKPISGFVPMMTSGVRLTHKPTGISVEETDERSPHKNKHIAWEKLKRLVAVAEEVPQPKAEPQSAQHGEPVTWQRRMRLRETVRTFPQQSVWTDWFPCTEQAAQEFANSKDEQWEYEVRTLYTAPQPRRRLTDEEIKAFAMEAFDSSWDADDETLVNKYGHGVYLWRFVDFARAIEATVWGETK